MIKEKMLVSDRLKDRVILELLYEVMFMAAFVRLPKVLLIMINDLLREEFDCDRDEIIIVERKY